ncbi:hypothetical protein [Spirillospora sp. NPDC029432]|uniref:hypothetical protein n=1 Tax=Spirillospora sp. NPDC029432 TaxID=3154599 RepID=UPI0034545253
MVARVLALRPRHVLVPVPRPRSSGSPSCSSSAVPAVTVGWDGLRSLHTARCGRCADALASRSLSDVDDWATAHRCDAELAALLADLDPRRAA